MPTPRKRQETDSEPKPDAEPTTDEPVNPDLGPKAESPTTGEPDSEPTTDEPEVPTLPDGWVAEHPLVAEAAEMVIAAEAHKDDPTPITDFVAAADKLLAVPVGFSLVEALETDEASLKLAFDTYEAIKALSDILRDKREVADRSDGDDLLEALVAMAKVARSGISSESDKAAIPVLFTRWRASAPKSSKGTGSPRTGDSDIPYLTQVWETDKYIVRYVCGSCGKKFSTRKDNLNSARNECIKHSRTHGYNRSNGTNDYQELTNRLFVLGLGDADHKGKHVNRDDLLDAAEGGGWKFTREVS